MRYMPHFKCWLCFADKTLTRVFMLDFQAITVKIQTGKAKDTGILCLAQLKIT